MSAEARRSSATIRNARSNDLTAIVELYNHYIEHSPATFDLTPFAVSDRRVWFTTFMERGRYQLLVAEEEGSIVGSAWSHQFRRKAAYDPSVETSVYVNPRALGRGIGAALYERLIERLGDEDVHRAYAGITLPNDASIALHRRFGFEEIGVFREVGRKFDRYWDVQWMERRFPES